MSEISQPSDSERLARMSRAEHLSYVKWLADAQGALAVGIIAGMDRQIDPDARGGVIFHTLKVKDGEWENARNVANLVLGRVLDKPTEEIANTEVIPMIGDGGTTAVDLRYWPLTPELDLIENARYYDSGSGTLAYSVGLSNTPQPE
jgi:hypothetical protein